MNSFMMIVTKYEDILLSKSKGACGEATIERDLVTQLPDIIKVTQTAGHVVIRPPWRDASIEGRQYCRIYECLDFLCLIHT